LSKIDPFADFSTSARRAAKSPVEYVVHYGQQLATEGAMRDPKSYRAGHMPEAF
jgi:hypothetical protein